MARAALRRRPRPSAQRTLGILTACLVGAFVWWRVTVHRAQVASYWTRPLNGGAQRYLIRTDDWFVAQRRTANMLGELAAKGIRAGSAFEVAIGDVFGEEDVVLVTIRDGDTLLRCNAVPLAQHCRGLASLAFDIPSPEHPQAHRIRPMGNGRMLVPIAGEIPAHGASPGGVITLWIDPELVLIPRLLATPGAVTEAATYFVRHHGDSVTVLSATRQGELLPRQRMAARDLAPLIARDPADTELIRGLGPDGREELAGHVYLPQLRWHVYRTMPTAEAFAPFRRQTINEAVLAFLLGSFIIGTLMWTARNQREQAIRAELLQARLDSLQAQLRPHFLFNALNTIVTFVHEDPERADTMLLRLADLLRLSLEHADQAEIPLRSELDILEAYLELERVRFGASLAVSRDVTPEALEVLVPRWILQPLAENAIKHSAAYTRGSVRLALSARVSDGALEVVLENDGPEPSGPTTREGVGLRNTRTRLDALYGSAASLELQRRAQGGATAVLRIPIAPDHSHATPLIAPRQAVAPA